MSSIADKLMERRAALIKQAEEVATKGVAEGRNLTVEEQTSFDGMIAEAGQLAERAKSIADGETRAKELEDSFHRETGNEKRDTSKDDGLGKWAREARMGDVFDLDPVKGAERRAMAARGEQRAMSASGGVGNDGVYGQLWEYAIAGSQILQAGVDVINTGDGNSLPFPVATVHSTTSDTPVAANGTIGTSDATLTTVQSTVSKYAFLTLVPSELVQDVTFDLEGYIAKSAGRELGRRVAKVASTAAIAGFNVLGAGNGASGYGAGFGTQSTAGQGSDLIVDLFHSVLPEYRTTASFVMADPTAAIVRKLKASTGEMVWQPALTAGDPDLILGKSVYIDPNLPSPATGAKSVYFGDWSALKVRIAGGLRFERSNEYAFNADQIAFRAIVRTGSIVVDPNAVKYFQHSVAA